MRTDRIAMVYITLEELRLLGEYLRKADQRRLAKEDIEGPWGLRGILTRVYAPSFDMGLQYLVELGTHLYKVEREWRVKKGLPLDLPMPGKAAAAV